MTHDELLKKIYSMELRYANEKPRREALRAVVELHKPNDILCSGCVATLYENCRTIQAVEKELA